MYIFSSSTFNTEHSVEQWLEIHRKSGIWMILMKFDDALQTIKSVDRHWESIPTHLCGSMCACVMAHLDWSKSTDAIHLGGSTSWEAKTGGRANPRDLRHWKPLAILSHPITKRTWKAFKIIQVYSGRHFVPPNYFHTLGTTDTVSIHHERVPSYTGWMGWWKLANVATFHNPSYSLVYTITVYQHTVDGDPCVSAFMLLWWSLMLYKKLFHINYPQFIPDWPWNQRSQAQPHPIIFPCWGPPLPPSSALETAQVDQGA